jgi:hypothetical protein
MVPSEWVDRWVRLGEELLTTPPGPAAAAPELAAAAAARDLAGHGSYWRRVEVEARLLAGEPAAAVAGKASLPAGVVEAYAALFYAVEDRLTCPGYVVGRAIRLYAPGAEADAGVQVRMLGYRGGPRVVDVVLAAVAPSRGGGAGDPPVDPRLLRLARLAVGVRATPVTPKNAGTWARVYALTRECRAAGVGPG